MQIEDARELADQSRSIEEALAERPDKAVRVRVQPMILRTSGTRYQYRGWKDVAWSVELTTVQEALEFTEALRAFFAALQEVDAEVLTEHLRTLAERKEVPA